MIIAGVFAPFKSRLYPITIHPLVAHLLPAKDYDYKQVKAWLDARFRCVEVSSPDKGHEGYVWYAGEDNAKCVALSIVKQNGLFLYPDDAAQP